MSSDEVQRKMNDEKLVANISGGTAFHGLCLGMDSNALFKPASQPVLKKTCSSTLMQPSMPTRIRTEYFQSMQEGVAFSKAISENGYSFGVHLKAKRFGFSASGKIDYKENEKTTAINSNEHKSTSITMFNIHFYPMRSFRFNAKQLELSKDALKNLRDVKDIYSAYRFLGEYGSHFPCDLHHVGGILIHCVAVSTTEQKSQSSLERIASDELKAAASVGYGVFQAGGNYTRTNSKQNEARSSSGSSNISLRFQYDLRGPNSTDPIKFEHLLRGDNASWHIIDRGNIFESLIPIWKIVYENHSEYKKEAELLCKAWLAKIVVADNSIDVVNQERAKAVEWKNNCLAIMQQPVDVEEVKTQLIVQTNLLGALDLKMIQEGYFLQQLVTFFGLVSKLEYYGGASDGTNDNDPWVDYVAKLPKICGLLKQLADKQEEYQQKFATIYGYLSDNINDKRLRKIVRAGCTLDSNVCAMLRRGSLSSSANNYSTMNTDSRNLPSVVVGNLANVLSEELRQHNIVHGNSEHKKIQQRMVNILREFFERPSENCDLRNQIFDLIVAEYDWDEEKTFKRTMTIKELETMIEGIRQLQKENAQERQFKRLNFQSTYQPDITRGESSVIRKKTYSDILIDRPFNNFVQTDNNNAKESHKNHLMNCLRHRMDFPNLESGTPGAVVPRIKPNIKKLSDKSKQPLVGNISLYDTLLHLVGEFDATGAVEIFRLLTERRSAIPLFDPSSKKHYLHLLNHVISVSSLEGVSMGQDVKLARVVVVSCRNKSQSQTSELLKSLFHMDSVHFHDFKKSRVTSENVTAEIGCGCLLTAVNGQKSVKPLMVVHVVGDFRPIWPFLAKFADYILVEDATDENESFSPAFLDQNPLILRDMVRASYEMMDGAPLVCVWKSTIYKPDGIEEMDHGGLRYYYLEGQFGSTTVEYLTSDFFRFALEESRSKQRLPLHQISLEDTGYGPLVYSMPFDVQLAIASETAKLSQVKNSQFRLQRIYEEQAKYEENWCDQRLEKIRKKEEASIRDCQRKRRAKALEVNDIATKGPKLLQLLLKLLTNSDPCSRILSVRLLEKILAERSERELGPQLQNIRRLYAGYLKKSAEASGKDGSQAIEKELTDQAAKLNAARTEFNDGVLSIEHLWRELSHYYTAVKPEHRSPLIAKIPQLAAQHLMDGLSIELLDGDSNRLHLDWVTEVLGELQKLIGKYKKERIFVLSVMGVQSSGKSTLLNTMFGIQMKTSVGQCTRGVNMQLLKVEGRSEYDYILLLDTEGCRAPEFHGLPGSEKRDNQMATLSILLADATIVTINGENVSAIQDILPIVLMAYQGSQLAEDNGGRRSSHMFFVFNRIETANKDKLSSIIMNLGTSLANAFRQVSGSTTGSRTESLNVPGTSQTPFTNFILEAPVSSNSESPETDVCILGNVKIETEPPNDVPNPVFGKSLIDFREHIHRRVTNARVAEGKPTWSGRSIDEFSQYMNLVWKCICSANFTLTFAAVVECITLDNMDYEYKMIEQDLTMAYRVIYESLEKEMISGRNKNATATTTNSDDARLNKYRDQLSEKVSTNITPLEERFALLVKGEGRNKWREQYKKKWEACKEDQEANWKRNLEMTFVTIFIYDLYVERYKKMMRAEFNELFQSAPINLQQSEPDKIRNSELFENIYQGILKVAEKDFPGVKIANAVDKVYADSHIINRLNSNDLDQQNIELEKKLCLEYIRIAKDGRFQNGPGLQTSDKSLFDSVVSALRSFFKMKMTGGSSNKLSTAVIAAFGSVYEAVNKIVAGEVCYYDSIVTKVILKTDEIIRQKDITKASEVQRVYIFGRTYIVQLMENIQWKWEAENSVSGKLKQPANKSELRHYFDLVSRGYRKTQLFAGHMANILKANIAVAFQEDMVRKMLYHSTDGIRNQRWLHDARFMQQHMDLYLANLLEINQHEKVLDYIGKPQQLYKDVLCKLIATKVPEVRPRWNVFVENVEMDTRTATAFSASVERGRAEEFVSKLKSALLSNPNLDSNSLAQAFSAISIDEFQDCDNEEKEKFQEACKQELGKVFRQLKPPNDQKEFAKKLCPKVIETMKTDGDPSTLPRCDACCRMCKSLCIKPQYHDPTYDKHDTIHQPEGVAGIAYYQTDKLAASTCSQFYENDGSFYLDGNYTVEYKYRDFDKVFPEWKNPRPHEDWPFREYILKTYNQQIADKYGKKPCEEIPPRFHSLELATIRRNLETATKQ